MSVQINKKFIGPSGLPLTLVSMNTQDPVAFGKSFAKSGLQDQAFFMIRDDGNYRGVNFVWQVMIQAKPEDVRKLFKTPFYLQMDNFRDDAKGTFKWENFEIVFTEIVRRNIVALLEKGIELEINGHRGIIDTYAGAIHFVGIEWFKMAYIKCYNEDNGIKEGCFITTAVCENFGKSDDCFELTTFRNFRDGWLSAQPDGKNLIAEYYAVAPRIVANINRAANPAKIYETIREKYLEPCLHFIMCGDNLSCKNKYIEMVTELKKNYL